MIRQRFYIASAAVLASLFTQPLYAGTSPSQLADPTKPISVDAASSDFNYRDNVLVFHKVRIAQGALSVEAADATATGLNFENSQWVFRGEVHIHLPDGLLDSDTATVTFKSNQLAHVLITGATGKPATFEQHRGDPDQIARGRAGTIEYDFTKGTVRLNDQAWLSDGRNEITGQTLVYDIPGQRIVANPNEQDQHGVSIIINPKNPSSGPEEKTTPAPPQAVPSKAPASQATPPHAAPSQTTPTIPAAKSDAPPQSDGETQR